MATDPAATAEAFRAQLKRHVHELSRAIRREDWSFVEEMADDVSTLAIMIAGAAREVRARA